MSERCDIVIGGDDWPGAHWCRTHRTVHPAVINPTADGPVDDIRARHAGPHRCDETGGGNDRPYGPCDAIREADRADRLLARCQELAERLDECGAEVVEQSDRADKAEAALADALSTLETTAMQMRAMGALYKAADEDREKAEAEAVQHWLRLMQAREDADRLADAVRYLHRASPVHGPDCRSSVCMFRAALAAHDALRKEAKP